MMAWIFNNCLLKLTICCSIFWIKFCFVSLKQETDSKSVEMQTNISKCFQTSLDDGTLLVNCSSQDMDRLPVLSNAHKLVVLDMSYNHIKKLEVLGDQDNFSNVIRLILGHNKIVDCGDPLNLNNAEELDLRYNRISDFTGKVMKKGMPKLKLLTLKGNKIHQINVHTFKQLLALKYLDLSFNSLVEWNFETNSNNLSDFSCNLETLDLSNNKIAKLTDKSFAFTDCLTDLNVSCNVLTKIEGAFETLLQLRVLDLSHNKLTTLPMNLFSKLNSLNYLYLSGNNLVTVPNVVPILTWFDLSFNKIQKVDETQSHVIYPHEVTLLGGNPFRCDCNLLWLKEFYDTREYLLKFINVDKNKFIPVCEYPETLKGDTWDVIGDDVFECDKDSKTEGTDQITLLDDTVDKVGAESGDSIIDFKASDITSESVRLEWLTNTALIVTISYRKFGDLSRKQAAVLPATVNSFVLRHLKANKPYIVCISLKEEGNLDKVEMEHCIEIMTSDDKSNNLEFLNLFSHTWLSILFVVFLTCTCAILAGGYYIYAQKSVSRKQKQS